jgi:Protein of unknown function (DUF2852)
MGCCGFGLGGWRELANGTRSSCGFVSQPPLSGSRAFEEYRAEMLRRLEQKEREFREFLERARMAKDRDEFDQFKAERRARPQSEGKTS